MSVFDLNIPNLNVDVSDSINKTLVVLRQPAVTLNRSSIPIQNVAESAITASYAVTSSTVMTISNTEPASPQTGSIYFNGSFIYVYDGTQYRSASLM
jgi:hypothetical protein